MNQAPMLHNAACILEQADKDFFIGIVGTGPGFESILQLMANPGLKEFFPRLRLVACTASEFPPDLAAKAKAQGASLYKGYREMLLAHPEINLLVELTSRPGLLLSLRQSVPPTISILDHASAVFLCAMLIMSEAFNKCKEALSEQQALLRMVMDELGDVLFLDAQGRISVSSGMASHDVFVTVTDTGVGIPLEDQEKIFSPFFTTKKKGSGLGLAMTKKIIGDLGGSLRLESQVGRGTTVTIFLPPYVSIPQVQNLSGTDRISDSL